MSLLLVTRFSAVTVPIFFVQFLKFSIGLYILFLEIHRKCFSNFGVRSVHQLCRLCYDKFYSLIILGLRLRSTVFLEAFQLHMLNSVFVKYFQHKISIMFAINEFKLNTAVRTFSILFVATPSFNVKNLSEFIQKIQLYNKEKSQFHSMFV